MYAYLECVEPSENCLRYYKVSVFENLFGDWQLDREWGRKGRFGTVGSTLHVSKNDAFVCAHGILGTKISAGYCLSEIDWEESNVVGFIPRGESAIFNLKLCSFFAGHPNFLSMALRMYASDILYVGELVQLSPEEIVRFFASRRGATASYFDGISEQLEQLRTTLEKCNLQLSAKIWSWKRPDQARFDERLVG